MSNLPFHPFRKLEDCAETNKYPTVPCRDTERERGEGSPWDAVRWGPESLCPLHTLHLSSCLVCHSLFFFFTFFVGYCILKKEKKREMKNGMYNNCIYENGRHAVMGLRSVTGWWPYHQRPTINGMSEWRRLSSSFRPTRDLSVDELNLRLNGALWSPRFLFKNTIWCYILTTLLFYFLFPAWGRKAKPNPYMRWRSSFPPPLYIYILRSFIV